MANTSTVEYKSPPVIEVLCGVLFQDLPKFQIPYFGLFWDRLRKDFPVVEERPPLDVVIEGTSPKVEVQFLTVPPIPRIWFISSDGRNLIQIQRDRFLYNWKRVDDDDPYPHFSTVYSEFEGYLETFMGFLRDEKIGEPHVLQYEMTYVNHITKANGLDRVDEGSALADHTIAKLKDRFLPSPSGYTWRTGYDLPENAGRLYVHAQSSTRAGSERIIRLDLTARGFSGERNTAGRRAWFDVGHEWICRGFADVTAEKLQWDVWGRTK